MLSAHSDVLRVPSFQRAVVAAWALGLRVDLGSPRAGGLAKHGGWLATKSEYSNTPADLLSQHEYMYEGHDQPVLVFPTQNETSGFPFT